MDDDSVSSDVSSEVSVDLSLSCSFSSFEYEEIDSSGPEDRDGEHEVVEPYRFEPLASETSAAESATEDADEDSQDEERLHNGDWCQCGHCVVMPTSRECVCCCEIERVNMKKQEGGSETSCITNHEGFQAVCLNVWVLQAAYFTYRHHYGDADEKDIHERYRFTAYRQLVGWCWGWLGQRVRVVLPSCAVNKIRTTFPSATYAGFKYPSL